MVADKIVNVFIKILASNAKVANFCNPWTCPLALAVNRRLKKGYRAAVGAKDFDIQNENYNNFARVQFDDEKWGPRVCRDMKEGKRGDLILKVQIPAKYLKRIHKPRVKKVVPVAPVAAPVVEVVQPKFDRPERVPVMRDAVKVLDKIFPKWREVSLDNLDMMKADDCLLTRIARLHGIVEDSWSTISRFLYIHHGCPKVFTSWTTVNDWAILIAEGKQE